MINKIGAGRKLQIFFQPQFLLGSLLREIKRFGKEYYLFYFERDY